MATTDNELNDLIINDISQEEYDNLVATGQVQEGQIYATDGTGSGGGSTTGGLESVAHDSSLEGAGTTASPLKVASTIIAQINDKADGAVVSGIEEKIPSSASATNQLATKADLPIGFDATVVAELPATGEKGIIYLVPKDGEAPDVHDEYIWIDSEQKFEFIGSTAVDLRDYATKEDLSTVLPDQTGNAGKFLTTDGTTTSWGNALVNQTTDTTSGIGKSIYILNVGKGVGLNLKDADSCIIGSTNYRPGGYGTVVGIKSGAEYGATNGVAIGWNQRLNAKGAIQIGGYMATNSDANTFKVANANGNFEMMSADGTIPAERMSSAVGTTGQVLTKTDDGMAWQDGAKGGASLPILMAIWSDHVIDDMSWLRADTFSWQSGDVYKAAYEHLLKDYDSSDFQRAVWGHNESGYVDVYTTTGMPEIGTIVYDTDIGEEVGTVSAIGDNYIDVDNYGDTYRFYRARDLDVISHSDTIGDITIKYALAQDGHKICLPDQEAKVVALYEQTGVAWYYILDTENKQFKLPRTKYGFTGLRDSVGGYVAPGLPNVEGDSGIVTTTGVPTGAFSRDGAKAKTWNTDSGSTYAGTTFDASRSNSIYGASDTVQPAATQMHLYFYVGNFEQSAIEQTAGLNAELFNGKADSDLKNIPTNYDYVVESQMPTAENGYTWYRKYKSGWVEQGGRWTGSFSISAFGVVNTPVTLPVPMTDAKYQAFAMATAQVGLLAITNPTNYQNTTTTLNVVIKEIVNGSRTVTEFVWQVSGYAA